MDSLLQELKIMGYIGFHINVIQLIGCYTTQLGSHGNFFSQDILKLDSFKMDLKKTLRSRIRFC
jgi:hypothetical protein